MPEDVYELQCQPTTDSVTEKKKVLVPYKTSSEVYKDLTLDTLFDSLIFQIVFAIFLMFVFYNFGKAVLKYIRTQSSSQSSLPARASRFFR